MSNIIEEALKELKRGRNHSVTKKLNEVNETLMDNGLYGEGIKYKGYLIDKMGFYSVNGDESKHQQWYVICSNKYYIKSEYRPEDDNKVPVAMECYNENGEEVTFNTLDEAKTYIDNYVSKNKGEEKLIGDNVEYRIKVTESLKEDIDKNLNNKIKEKLEQFKTIYNELKVLLAQLPEEEKEEISSVLANISLSNITVKDDIDNNYLRIDKAIQDIENRLNKSNYQAYYNMNKQNAKDAIGYGIIDLQKHWDLSNDYPETAIQDEIGWYFNNNKDYLLDYAQNQLDEAPAWDPDADSRNVRELAIQILKAWKDVLYDDNFWEKEIYQDYDILKRFNKEDVKNFVKSVKEVCRYEYEIGLKNVGKLN